jgi:4-hydroxyacetophenone monooxygenase
MMITLPERDALVDDAFIQRAFEEADLNALRMALYQATDDETLAQMQVRKVEAHGGATSIVTLAPEHHDLVKRMALDFLRTGGKAGPIPADAKLRQMMEMLLGAPLTDKDFTYQRTIPAFDDFPYGACWTGERPSAAADFHVAIIGAGISGIATGIQFERLGIPYTIFERQPELGGTWSINTYPDVRVDTTNFVYQFSFEKNYPWREYFGRQAEVRDYLEHVARKYGVFRNIQFNADVTEARWDEDAAHWTLQVAGTTQGFRANAVVAASGLFGVPKPFDIAGADGFAGEIVHTARWHKDVDLRGRRVAVIGNGSTGVQLLARIAEEADQVTVFQRTPQWISPRERYGQAVSAEMRWLLDTMPHFWNWSTYSLGAMGLSHQPLQDMDYAWQAAGGTISEQNDKYRANLTEYIHAQLGDRHDLIKQVTPRHAPMARRLIVDNGWYKALLRANVALVTAPIERLTQHGVRTVDGQEREADLIVAAIGFQASKYCWPMDYFGLGGGSLHERWDKEGTPRAYLGITIPDFPNFFMHYGPNSQPRAGSLMAWQEIWSRYSAQAIVHLIENGARAMTLKSDVFERYNENLDRAAASIVWNEKASRDRNYYVDDSGRSSVNAPWRMEDYYQFFHNKSWDDYDIR